MMMRSRRIMRDACASHSEAATARELRSFVFISVYSWLEFMGPVRAKDEFELQKNGIDVASRKEEI